MGLKQLLHLYSTTKTQSSDQLHFSRNGQQAKEEGIGNSKLKTKATGNAVTGNP
jgi:hypothetical protein